MPGYGQFCPVAQALDLVGERWSLLILRELLCADYRFTDLMNGLPLISRSLLSARLKSLEGSGLVQKRTEGQGHVYVATPAARELEPILVGLGLWGKRWVKRKFTEEELDPILLMWELRRGIELEAVPQKRTLIHFWFRDLPAQKSRYWLEIDPPQVEVCLSNPGFAPGVTVETKLRTLVDVWMGRRPLRPALASREIVLSGDSKLVRGFPSWLRLNIFAHLPTGERALSG